MSREKLEFCKQSNRFSKQSNLQLVTLLNCFFYITPEQWSHHTKIVFQWHCWLGQQTFCNHVQDVVANHLAGLENLQNDGATQLAAVVSHLRSALSTFHTRSKCIHKQEAKFSKVLRTFFPATLASHGKEKKKESLYLHAHLHRTDRIPHLTIESTLWRNVPFLFKTTTISNLSKRYADDIKLIYWTPH